jgi:hypothetical protein
MATATLNRTAAKGGSFLLESPAPADVFTPADLTDDQKLIGQAAEEFVVNEVLPLARYPSFISERNNRRRNICRSSRPRN